MRGTTAAGRGCFGQHLIRVSPDSMLGGILPEPDMFIVPTYHHQAVDLLGDGLQAVAWEEDGLIEAVEAGPSQLGGLPGFVLGVQWHPEQARGCPAVQRAGRRGRRAGRGTRSGPGPYDLIST